jgi:hypothetical protein
VKMTSGILETSTGGIPRATHKVGRGTGSGRA